MFMLACFSRTWWHKFHCSTMTNLTKCLNIHTCTTGIDTMVSIRILRVINPSIGIHTWHCYRCPNNIIAILYHFILQSQPFSPRSKLRWLTEQKSKNGHRECQHVTLLFPTFSGGRFTAQRWQGWATVPQGSKVRGCQLPHGADSCFCDGRPSGVVRKWERLLLSAASSAHTSLNTNTLSFLWQ